MYSRAIAFFCLFIVPHILCYEGMDTSGDPILEYLQMDPDSVSDHELVKIDLPGRLHERDVDSETLMNFQAFGDRIELRLYTRDSILVYDETPVYYAHHALGYVNDVYYERVDDAMKGVGKLLEDPNYLASMVIDSDASGRTTVNGNLRSRRDNARLVIRSLPEDIVNGYLRKRRSTTDHLNKHLTNSTYHVVVKLNGDDLAKNPIEGFNKSQLQTSSDATNAAGYFGYTNTNYQKPDTVYPQIFVHVDFTYRTDWRRDTLEPFLAYILAFWNGVDMIYRDMENPKVKLNIAAIVIAVEPLATPYIWHSMHKDNYTVFDCYSALDRATLFYYSIPDIFPHYSFDIAVTMTKLTLAPLPPAEGFFNGMAFRTSSACVRWHERQQHFGVALVHDNGGFSGISVAAHEIAHTMGAYHELDEVHTDCPKQNEFLMTNGTLATINSTTLSTCSRNDLRKSFEAGYLDCMYNVPPIMGKILPGLMAGKLANLERQCSAHGFALPCIPHEIKIDICAEIWCASKDDSSMCNPMAFAAAPGTYCLTDIDNAPGACFKNRCIGV